MPLVITNYADLKYGSLLTYNNKLSSDIARKSVQVCAAVKRADTNLIGQTVEFIRNSQYGAGILHDILLSTSTLVPVPGSGLYMPGQIRPPVSIAQNLVAAGLGREVSQLLIRTTAVPKSAFASAHLRPTVATHVESMAVGNNDLLNAPSSIVLIDDVLTQGRMLYASYIKIKAAFPNIPIAAFTLIRTMNFVQELRPIVDPVIGSISYTGSVTNRSHNYY